MKRFLFAALTFASLCCFTGCGDKNEIDYGQTETPDYVFVDSHMTFTYNLQGAVSEMVKVNVTSTLPASKGKTTVTNEGSKYTVSISNIQCPTEFDLKFQLVPKENLSLDDLKKSWIAKANTPCIFISAREKLGVEKLRNDLYGMVREIHAGRYPFNNFLY